MSTRTAYLLPCSCGQKIVVDKSQAGLALRCHCGAEVTVPTLRGFSALEQTTISARPARQWSRRQAVIFLGASIAVIGLLLAGWYELHHPPYPQEFQDGLLKEAGSTDDLGELTPTQLNTYWRSAQLGPDYDTSPAAGKHAAVLRLYAYAMQAYRTSMLVALGITAIGALIVFVGWMLPKRNLHRAANP